MTQPIFLNDLLNINQKEDLLYVNDERHLLIPSSSFGFLQRDLIHHIGMDRMKTFFFRHGENTGIKDAKEAVKNSALSIIEKINYFIVLRSLKGYVRSTITEKELDIKDGHVTTFRFKGIWEDSFEAEQHIQHMGISDHPICYTLMGYASGAISYILGEQVFFKEHQCKGEGAPFCIWEGRLLSDWEEGEYREFINNNEIPILKELELSYKKLMDEKNNLSMVMKIDCDLTDGVVQGKNIEGILGIVEKQIMKTVVAEDLLHQITYVQGMTVDKYEPIKKEFQHFLKKMAPIQHITELQHSNCTRLVTPIYLKEKIVGYCSFLYEGNNKVNHKVDSMILSRVSSICSLIILNRKVELESTERMKGYLLEEILNGKYQSEQEILKKTFFIDLDFTGGYYAIHLKYTLPAKQNKQNPYFHNEIFEYVTKYMSEKGIHVLLGQKTDSLLLLLPQKQLGEKKIDQVIYPFISSLRKRLNGTVWFAGISSIHSSVFEEVKAAFKEAQTAVKLSTKETPVTFFRELGILGLLVNEENKIAIRKIAELTLGNLYKNLDQGKVELIETLYTFLTNGGNFEQTAEQLNISISGLRYRLNKITNLLGSDIREPEIRFQMLLTLKALRALEDEWLEIQ